MYVHILTKVWHQMMHYRDMQKEAHKGAHICRQLGMGWSRHGGGVDMHSCIDACTLPNQGMGPD